MINARTWIGAWIAAGILTMGTAPAALYAEFLTTRLDYPQNDLVVTRRDGFSRVTLPGCGFLERVGAPALPQRSEHIVLPEGAAARAVRAVSLSAVRLPVDPVRPAQPPAILGPIGVARAAPAFRPPDDAVYKANKLYPEELVVFRGTGRFAGVHVAACEVRPVQYDPARGEIVLHTAIALEVELERTTATKAGEGPRREMSRVVEEITRRAMHGDGIGEPARSEKTPELGRASSIAADAYQYVVITDERQQAAYQRYAAWKTAKGLPATVVTTGWINANYGGRDLPDRIRNFIIDARDRWGTSYVLLGGDAFIVPSRIAWAFDCQARLHADENDLYADLYYSDLDGDWDRNRNGIYGEVGDEVDLYPDVLVGRAPTRMSTEAEAVVSKFLIYDRAMAPGHAMDAYFFAEILWPNPYTDGGVGKDMIAERHFGAFEPVERHYEAMGNESLASVTQALNRGPNLVNHAGHAFHGVMGCGPDALYNQNVDLLANAPNFFVLYSIGCWAGAFDYDSIGEHFVRNPVGGAIAFIGNSRYGWGSPGNPGWGYSDTFDSDFYGAILTEGLTELGAAVAWAKVLRIPFSRDGNVYRWHQYQVNLLGDPEMRCHTADLQALGIEAPHAISSGSATFAASVFDDDGPVAGARLCLAGIDVYQVGLSDAGGRVVFSAEAVLPQVLTLTATAANHTYAERRLHVGDEDAVLSVTSTRVDDDVSAAGNGDGRIGAGETIELWVTVHNSGDDACDGVEATLSTTSPHVTVVDPESSYGTVAGNSDATATDPFVVEVDPDCPADGTIPFVIVHADAAGGRWTESLPLPVVEPAPRIDHYRAIVDYGDGDRLVEPGETVAVTVSVVNVGGGDLGPTRATLTTADPDLTIRRAVATAGRLEPGESAVLDPPFQVRVAADCPTPRYCSLDLALAHDGGNDMESLLLAVGQMGFVDDMEVGAAGWSHAGTNDLWQLTETRQHSGSSSWYCGTDDGHYVDQMNSTLTTPMIVVPENARLSFWCTFDVTIYGSDGLYVEFLKDDAWETLDFIGSGGALDSLLVGCQWTEHVYELHDLQTGGSTQARFRFVSDARDHAEGFYIDDVAIRSISAHPVDPPPTFGSFAVTSASPNPMRSDASWRLSLAEPTRVTATVYGANGRLVRRLLSEDLGARVYELRWDGTAIGGGVAPAGIYFLRVTAGRDEAIRRIIRLR